MTTYQYLIIGGGMIAAAAVDGIREVDSTGSIDLIGNEIDTYAAEADYDQDLAKVKAKNQVSKTQNTQQENNHGSYTEY